MGSGDTLEGVSCQGWTFHSGDEAPPEAGWTLNPHLEAVGAQQHLTYFHRHVTCGARCTVITGWWEGGSMAPSSCLQEWTPAAKAPHTAERLSSKHGGLGSQGVQSPQHKQPAEGPGQEGRPW